VKTKEKEKKTVKDIHADRITYSSTGLPTEKKKKDLKKNLERRSN